MSITNFVHAQISQMLRFFFLKKKNLHYYILGCQMDVYDLDQNRLGCC